MKYFSLLALMLCLSCGNDKLVMLPEIEHASITKIHDVSAAYLFYDETLPDSIELNRKNLISTTNWLINVDKRLTLEQAIPKIMLLQDKKRNAELHKNENAKNYFTCNDTSIQNLGFLEFTEVIYDTIAPTIPDSSSTKKMSLLKFHNPEHIEILSSDTEVLNINLEQLIRTLEDSLSLQNTPRILTLAIEKHNTFQDYISLKSILSNAEISPDTIDNREFIY
ncbi:hypothetical protein [Mangrovimonas xylaniphaga]|uniref:hypothetical protein n=1 Tax=Mangrovimonas xylaniphaga TaxID=1645915 RepID=UPI0006B5AF16|nr:hypothetical protein [Mangrovimonas xylaniphaga]